MVTRELKHSFVQPSREKGKVSNNSGLTRKSDGEIWKLFKEGDESAFIFIYRQYINSLFSFGCQFSHDDELVKDCLQEFFIEIRNSRSRLSDTTSIKHYLYKAFKRKVIEFVKRSNIRKERDFLSGKELFTVELSIENKIISQQLTDASVARLNTALQSLSSKEREAIYYFFYENFTYKEIAALLNFCNVTSARRLVYNALKSLKALVIPATISFILSLFYI